MTQSSGVRISTRLADVVTGRDDVLLDDVDRRELIRAERALAEVGQSARYVVVEDRPGIPIGLLPIYPVTRPYRVTPHPRLVLGGSRVTRGWRTGCYLGSLGRASGLVVVAPGAPPKPVREALVRDAWRLVTAEADQLDFACFPLLDAESLAAVLPQVAAQDPTLVTSDEPYIPIRFDSFAGYLATRPRKQQAMITREQRRFQGAGLRIVELDLLTRHSRLAPLLRNVEQRYTVAGTVEDYASYLAGIAETLGDQATCLVACHEDDPTGQDPVAFTVVSRQDTVRRIRCWGCDPSRVEGTYAYFNMVIYEPLRRAIATGARKLVLGRGSTEAKRRRGAELDRKTSVAVALNPIDSTR
ncbi:GNAT family N-acetyltransferase [Micromonospora sp. CPCC 206061]|uniref:GNAT family N-acetyltransferase n=1 Tax=Micromonospora sp. CPCC 206061 TaxID=3122410 RepID=UPI002FF04FB7